jgi:hypothetical protein
LATDDFVVVDHRSSGLGTVGLDEYVASVRALADLAPDFRVRITSAHFVSSESLVEGLFITATNVNGGAVEWAYSALVTGRTGRVERVEHFPLGDPQTARDLSVKPDAASDTPLVEENAVSRLVNEWADSFRDGDLHGYLALHADDFRADDRRTGLQLQVAGASVEEQARLIIAFLNGRRPEISIIATRDDVLALFQATFRGSMGVGGDAEISFLLMEELDAHGRFSHAVMFDPDDLAAALTELDDRYSERLPPDEVEVFTLARALVDCYNRRDWDELKELFADNGMIVDERMTGWGTINVDEFVLRSRELTDMVPDAYLMNVMVDRAGMTRSRVSGTVPDGGGPFELVFDTVATVRAGRIARLDLLPPATK